MAFNRWIIAVIDTALRLAALGFVWAAAGLLTLLVFRSLFLVVWIGLVTGIAAFTVSHFILRKPFLQLDMPETQSEAQTAPKTRATTEKTKRGNETIGDMLSLLDEDDRYDLQQRIKERLMDQIDNADAAEMGSFEELLSKSAHQKRR